MTVLLAAMPCRMPCRLHAMSRAPLYGTRCAILHAVLPARDRQHCTTFHASALLQKVVHRVSLSEHEALYLEDIRDQGVELGPAIEPRDLHRGVADLGGYMHRQTGCTQAEP